MTALDIKDFFKSFLLKPSYVAKHCPEFFHKTGSSFRKISFQIVGFKASERRKLQGSSAFDNLEFLQERPGEAVETDDYFIENVPEFKGTLLSFPPQF